MRWAGAGGVVALLLIVTVVRIAVEQPGYGIAFYALIPIVMAAFLFGRLGGLVTAGAASVLYLVSELISPLQTLRGTQLWVAAANRSAIYFIVAVTVTVLLERERGLRSRVEQQERQLEELRSIREALTPTEIPARPGLEVAAAFIPAEGLVAGDFFLVASGPMNSTTIVVGDVAGHGSRRPAGPLTSGPCSQRMPYTPATRLSCCKWRTRCSPSVPIQKACLSPQCA